MKSSARKALAGTWLLLGLVTAGWAADSGFPPDLGDVVALEAFLDGAVGEHMARAGTPGAVVVVVRNDKVLVAKGYGYADLETRRKVDPAATVWRVGSIAKVFTATAVMQQVERGRIRLEDDVNRYLEGWKVEAAFGQPVTVGSLLTHTSGFDLAIEDLAAEPGAAPEPLGAWLKRTMPARVRPPGEVFQYSNHGTALAGHLVERVTGKRFEDYVRDEIFVPLGMASASFEHRPEQEPFLALGYAWNYLTGRHFRLDRYEFQFGPAASLRATGLDMVPFMRAHLGDGAVDGKRILSADTRKAMHTVRFTHHELLPGLASGLFAGPRGLGHAGGSLPHISSLVLLPSKGVGIFFSTNALSGAGLLATLQDQLLQRYFPRPEPEPWAPVPPSDGGLARFEGSYRFVSLPTRGPARLPVVLLPFFPEVTVRQVGPGVLAIAHLLRRQDLRIRQIAPLVFDREDGDGVVAFHEAEGEVRRLCLRAFLPLALERISPWERRELHALALVGFLLGFLWMTLGRLCLWLWGRWGNAPPWGSPYAWGLAGLVALLDLGVLAAPWAALLPFRAGLPALAFGRPWLATTLLAGGPPAALATLALVPFALALVRDPHRSVASKAGFLLGLAVLVAFLPWARYWGML